MLASVAVITSVLLAACGSSPGSSAAFNDDDVMFAQMMIPHHEQAVEMADIALDPAMGAGAGIVVLANRIKAAQDPEIVQMKSLLTEWGKPESPDDGMDHGSMMSGMLSTDELEELAALNGAAFDAAWAAAMIKHHEGAIDMAKDVLDNGKNESIKTLAGAIIGAQEKEISELEPLAG